MHLIVWVARGILVRISKRGIGAKFAIFIWGGGLLFAQRTRILLTRDRFCLYLPKIVRP